VEKEFPAISYLSCLYRLNDRDFKFLIGQSHDVSHSISMNKIHDFDNILRCNTNSKKHSEFYNDLDK